MHTESAQTGISGPRGLYRRDGPTLALLCSFQSYIVTFFKAEPVGASANVITAANIAIAISASVFLVGGNFIRKQSSSFTFRTYEADSSAMPASRHGVRQGMVLYHARTATHSTSCFVIQFVFVKVSAHGHYLKNGSRISAHACPSATSAMAACR